MEPFSSLLALVLFKATEKIWEKGFDAAWEPVGDVLKSRFFRWAGKGEEQKRKVAFEEAMKMARTITVSQASNARQTERVLDAIEGRLDQRVADAFAEEATNLMLFSAIPDIMRLTDLCNRTLHFERIVSSHDVPPVQFVASVLSDFLANLREGLLSQEVYHDLVQQDMRRTLRDILIEIRPHSYDDETDYRMQMAEMHRELGFVGIPELKDRRPITITDIFIRLRAVQKNELIGKSSIGISTSINAKKSAFYRRSAEELDELFPEDISLNESLRMSRKIVVLGDPGAGKTTLLKYLTIICAEKRTSAEIGIKSSDENGLLPIFVTLREFSSELVTRDKDYSLVEYLYTYAHERLMLNLQRGFFERALEKGRCFICLDGLDEVWAVGQRSFICEAVKSLAIRYPDNHYVITSRLIGYEEAPLSKREFVHQVIQPLRETEIIAFINKWYELRERDVVQRKKKADNLINTIRTEDRIGMLARNPLLLTIIALVHRIEAELPQERVKLYDKCVTALVDTWEDAKGLTIEEKKRPSYQLRRRLLERLAYELQVGGEKPRGVRVIKEGDLELLVARFLMENPKLGLSEDPDAARDEARAFIRIIRSRTGLLIENGEGVFSFAHLTFQEYLTACDIENRCIHRGIDAIWNEIQNRLQTPHWREVILLLLGSLNKYDEAPTNIVERILQKGGTDKFEKVLHRYLYLATEVISNKVDVSRKLNHSIVDALVYNLVNGYAFLDSGVGEVVFVGEFSDMGSAIDMLGDNDYLALKLLEAADNAFTQDSVRSAIASILHPLGYKRESSRILHDLFYDRATSEIIRRDAIATIGRFQCGDESLVNELKRILREDNPAMRHAAALALGRCGFIEDALDVINSLIYDGNVPMLIRTASIDILDQLQADSKDKIEDILINIISGENTDIELLISAMHSGVARESVRVREIMFDLMSDPLVNKSIRRGIIYLPYLLRDEEMDKIQILMNIATNELEDTSIRISAIESIINRGKKSEIKDALLSMSDSSELTPIERIKLAEQINRIDERKVSVSVILPIISDEDCDMRLKVMAIGALDKKEISEEFVKLVRVTMEKDEIDGYTKIDASDILYRMGFVNDANMLLHDIISDVNTDYFIRTRAARILSLRKQHISVEVVINHFILDSSTDALRYDSFVGDVNINPNVPEKAVDELLAIAGNKQNDISTRYKAYITLKRLVSENE